MEKDTRTHLLKNLGIIENNKRINDSNRLNEHMRRISNTQNNYTSGGCYIATMVYGDYEHPQVLVLREFRDNFLAHYLLGRVFIRFYYKYSPSWVEALEHNKMINKSIKKALNALIKIINITHEK